MNTIAIVGKPNVGKSSLFNRLIKQHLAITSSVSGTTRDVKKAYFTINDVEVEIIDTGGLEKTNALFTKVSEHSQKAAFESDMVLYMVDGSIIPQDDDIAHFRALQRHKKPLALIVNKIDNDKLRDRAWDFSTFGAEHICFISVQHNRGISFLLEVIYKALHLQEEKSLHNDLLTQFKAEDIDESIDEFLGISQPIQKQENECIAVSIIGRVNVGKSSLLNALLGKERSVVSEIAGSTMDPVDDEIQIADKRVKFIDTAGIRRAGKIDGIEKFALIRTNTMLSQSHIAILVLDASEPFVQLDEKISSLIPKHALGVIVVFNKWDKKYESFKDIQAAFAHRFAFLSFAPVMTLSALNGRNIDKLKMMILKVYERFCYRIPTSELNEVINKAINAHHIPSDHGKIVKIYYATQYDIKPPQIALISNRPNSLHFSYKRYLINAIREQFDFEGVPLFLSAKSRSAQTGEKVTKHKRHQRGDKNTRF